MTKLDELKRLAEKATPGPWKQRGFALLSRNELVLYLDPTENYTEKMIGNREYIAAVSPSVILKLLERIKDAEKIVNHFVYLNAAKDYRKKWHDQAGEDG